MSPVWQSTVTYELSASESRQVTGLVERLIEEYPSPVDHAFVATAADLARSLPDGLVRFLRSFQGAEPAVAAVIRGLPVDDKRVGPTPEHWSAHCDPARTMPEDFYFLLLGSLIGEVFGWSTLQNGALLHNVLPNRAEENDQSGAGSRAPLLWHIEDAFHPYRCDYLALMALRNPDEIGTSLGSVRNLKVTQHEREVLWDRRFHIRPDKVHMKGLDVGAPGAEFEHSPQPVSILFGDADEPYLRINPPFMTALPGDEEAEQVLADVISRIDESMGEVILHPGDVVFIDNYLAVHGRGSFIPRYDGTDRWMRKALFTRDLRKSRGVRDSADGRVLRLAP
ncbi:MAG TPA: guanitoxin biosynthesis L-enduracididine beta-hydroxylase GntD [Streptosporangiaceae bacterium]|nr:guanitoxin biosynthesis L-enduracididine beta-hydroxylase GntD [Streptosporangiaceae bacterium]